MTLGIVRRAAILASLMVIGGLYAPSPSLGGSAPTYCAQNAAVNNGCPPLGNSMWAHLQSNQGSSASAVCVDEFNDPNGNGSYTGPTCPPIGTVANQGDGGTWGYPRVWNNGPNGAVIFGTEYY